MPVLFALILCVGRTANAQHSNTQQARVTPPTPERYRDVDASDDASIEDLITNRIRKAWNDLGPNFRPELLRTEANYARLSATSRDALYEASFHLRPQYFSHGSTGPDTSSRIYGEQPIMYYIGSARTPLALPMVSNISKALGGDEASYTINLGVLPLPIVGAPDSMRYYVVIERMIESNHTDASVRLERFAKEFSAKVDEPVFLRLANEPLAKGKYIVQLEDNSVLDFYDDFSRFIEEHIILEGHRLSFGLGTQTISDISERLSIPYSVAQTCLAKVELLSVVDTAHPRTIVDTLRQPADYLAEIDMSKFSTGPYRYRFTATEPGTGKVLYSETHSFNKTAPVVFVSGSRLGSGDTLKVGRKQIDYAAMVRELQQQNAEIQIKDDRDNAAREAAEREKQRLETIVLANKKSTIADVHGRIGVGIGSVAGDNFFIGIEANRPALSFDVSFGYLYAGAPYLDYDHPQIFSQMFSSPKSLGFQLTWIPVKFFDGLLEPQVGVGYYGIWTTPTSGGLGSATLLSGQIGVACEPLGEVHGLGFSLSYGAAYGLGLTPSNVGDFSVKAYVRF